jgi:hypothetical protein
LLPSHVVKKKKKRKAKKGEATKLQPLDNKSPRSVSVSLSDRYTTLPKNNTKERVECERYVLAPLAKSPDKKTRQVLIPPIDLAQAHPKQALGNKPRRNRKSRECRRRRHRSVSDVSTDIGEIDSIAIMPHEERDHGATVPMCSYPDEDEDEDEQLPMFSPRIGLTTSPGQVAMPMIDDAARHRGPTTFTMAAESDVAYHRRAMKARLAVGSPKQCTRFLQEEKHSNEYVDVHDMPKIIDGDFKIIVGSFGFAEEGDTHFLKMDVWDTVPVRCNSR